MELVCVLSTSVMLCVRGVELQHPCEGKADRRRKERGRRQAKELGQFLCAQKSHKEQGLGRGETGMSLT